MLRNVWMFWEGNLSRLERLSIASFVANGHPVTVFGYNKPDSVPDGANWEDASRFIPKSKLFRTKKGSLGAFSDYFRAMILHQEGGIWADTDVVCLRPLDYQSDFIVGEESSDSLNGAVLGLPPGHEIASRIIEAVENPSSVFPMDTVRERRRKLWRKLAGRNKPEFLKFGEVGPAAITKWVDHLGLREEVLPYWHFYPVPPTHWRFLFDKTYSDSSELFAKSRTIHLWNEFIRKNGVNKNGPFEPASLIEQLCARYGIQ